MQQATPLAPVSQQSTEKKKFMPKLEYKLPKFNGSPEFWISWSESFRTMIHENEDVSKVLKYHFLRAAMDFPAGTKNVLDNFSLSETCYDAAWSALCKRYDDPKALKAQLLHRLLAVKKMNGESVAEVRRVIDEFSSTAASMNIVSTTYDDILIHIVTKSLDETTNREWQRSVASKKEDPSFQDLMDFLQDYCGVLTALQPLTKKPQDKPAPSVKAYASSTNMSCLKCKDAHHLYHCPNFKTLTAQERYKFVMDNKLCRNCFSPSHIQRDCASTYRCRHCNQSHHTLIHPDNSTKPVESQSLTSTQQSSSIPPPPPSFLEMQQRASSEEKPHYPYFVEPKLPTVTSKPRTNLSRTNTSDQKSFSSLSDEALLTTAVVRVRDPQGYLHEARCLLDSGSQSNYITTEFAAALGLHFIPMNLKIVGVNGQQSEVKHCASVTLSSRYRPYTITTNCYVSDDITGLLPNRNIDISSMDIPQNLFLADPRFHMVGKVDILLGSAIFHDIQLPNIVKRTQLPALFETELGWTIGGQLPVPPKSLPSYFTKCFIQQPPIDRNQHEKSHPASSHSNHRYQSRQSRAPGSACESPPSPRPRNPVAKNRWTSNNHPNCKSLRPDQLQDDSMTSRQFQDVAVRRRHRSHHFRRINVQNFIATSSSTSSDGLDRVRRPTPGTQLAKSLRRGTVAPRVEQSQFPRELELRPAPSMTPHKSADVFRGRSLTVGFTTRQTDIQFEPDVRSRLKNDLKNSTSRFTPDSSNSRRSQETQRCGNVTGDDKLRQTPKTA
jgi:hypothetical protein